MSAHDAGAPPATRFGAAATQSLARGVGRWELVLLLVNCIIGAGILGLPSTVFALANVYSLLALLLSVATLGLAVLCIAELGSRFSVTGGPVVYVRFAFGPFAGFLVGWLLWVSRLFSFATIAILMTSYTAGLFGTAFPPVARAAFMIVLTAALGAVLLRGIRETTLANNAFAAVKILLLGGFVVIGAFFVDVERLSAVADVPPADFLRAATLWVFALLGIEGASVMAGEAREPRRDVPFATIAGLVLVAVIYLSVHAVAIGTLPDLAQSTQPIAEAAQRFLGSGAARLIAVGALVMMLGTNYAIYLIATRTLFALAEQRTLPPALAAVHSRFRTPYVAIAITGVLIATIAVLYTFITALALAALVRLLVYAMSVAAMLRIRRLPDAPPARFVLPAGGLLGVLALLACGLLMVSSSKTEALTVAAVLLSGAVVFAWEQRRQARSSSVG